MESEQGGRVVLVTGAARGSAVPPRSPSHGAETGWSSPTAIRMAPRRPSDRSTRSAGRPSWQSPTSPARRTWPAWSEPAWRPMGGSTAHTTTPACSATPARLADCDEAEWDRVVGTNLKGTWLCLKHEVRRMAEHGGGVIVNTASTFGLTGTAYGLSPYVASKHGIVGLTRAAALEYAREGVRINAVCPSLIRTPMIEPLLSGNPRAGDNRRQAPDGPLRDAIGGRRMRRLALL